MRFRKITIFIGVLFLLLFLWHLFFRLPGLRVHPLEAVSSATSMVIDVPDGRLMLHETMNLDSFLGNFLQKKQYQTDLNLLRQALPKKYFKPFSLLLSLQNPGTDQLALMAVADVRGQQFELERMVRRLPIVKFQRLFYRNQQLYRLFLKSGTEVTMAQYRNLVLIAPYPLLVEDAIVRLSKPYGNWLWQRGFRPLSNKTPADVPFSIYIYTENMPLLLSDWLEEVGKNKVENWKSAVQWIRVNPQTAAASLFFKGSMTTAKTDNLWSALGAQRARPIGAMMRVIPDNVAMVRWLSVSNIRKLVRGASAFRSAHFQEYISTWAGDELGLVQMQDERFVVLKYTDEQLATERLHALAKKVGQLQAYQYGTFQVQQIMDENLFESLLGANGLMNPYFVFIEKYIVFASSKSALEVWMDEYIVGKTMGHSNDFLQLYQKWQKRPIHAFLFLNMANFAPYLRKQLNTKALLNDDHLEQLGHIGMVLTKHKGNWDIEGYWSSERDTLPAQANIVWKTLLNKEAIIPTQLVGEGTPESPYLIAVQDADFQLYLLNSAGRIIAKKKLDGKILSAIKSIPYYKTGEHQLIFNTANNIYLLSQFGENQGTFPLHLQTPATNGMTVIDFDGNQQFSFFVACKNGGIYGFDQFGRPLQGWNPLGGVGELAHPVLHFQDGGKDFLIALNKQGKLWAYKRDGSTRFAPISFGVECPSPPQVQLSEKEKRIVAMDKNGKAHIVRLDGTTFGLALFPKSERAVQFAFDDVVGDARKDYMALSDTSLVVFHYDGSQFKPAFRQGFATPQRDLFTVRLPEVEKAFIGTVSAHKQQIMILKEGKVHPDFPLGGTTRFFVKDLYQNGQQMLVVANGDSVYAYRVEL